MENYKKYIGYVIWVPILVFLVYKGVFNNRSGALYHDGSEFVPESTTPETRDLFRVFIIENYLFSVAFPTEPNCTDNTENDKNIKVEHHSCISNEYSGGKQVGQYHISWATYPDSIKRQDSQQTLRDYVSGKFNGTNPEEINIELGVHKDYNFINYVMNKDTVAHGKIILVDSIIIDLGVEQFPGAINKTRERFIDSFSLKID